MTDVTPHDLHLLLVEIRAELKATRADIARHLAEDNKVHADHESRLRKNDQFRWGSSAVIAVITALGTWGIFT